MGNVCAASIQSINKYCWWYLQQTFYKQFTWKLGKYLRPVDKEMEEETLHLY